MREFFASLYEWFGLMPFYSKDLGEHLRGLDNACTGYFAISWYIYTGWLMIIVTACIFALQFDLISSVRFGKREHGLLAGITVFVLNFIIGFTIPFIGLFSKAYCIDLKFSVADCFGFGFSNAIWGLVFYGLLSTTGPLYSRIFKK